MQRDTNRLDARAIYIQGIVQIRKNQKLNDTIRILSNQLFISEQTIMKDLKREIERPAI